MTKFRRQNADDGVKVVIGPNFVADDGGIAAKNAAPQTITDHHRIGEAISRVALVKKTAELRPGAQQAEVVRAHTQKLNALRAFTAGQVGRRWPYNADSIKNPSAVAQVFILGLRKGDAFGADARQVSVDLDQLSGIVKWKRTQQHRIDDAEDRSISSDSDGEGEQGNGSHRPGLQHPTKSKTDIQI